MSDLFQYPISPGAALPNHFWIKIDYRDYFADRFYHRASPAARGLAIELMMISQDQKPLGTLPDCPFELASLMRVSGDEEIERLRAEPFGPFYGWRPCSIEGSTEPRLYNPKVLALCEAKLAGNAEAEADKARRKNAAKFRRLEDLVKRCGGGNLLHAHAELLEDLAAMLEGQGNWTEARVRAALEGWQMRRDQLAKGVHQFPR